jgi:hypothetical protein
VLAVPMTIIFENMRFGTSMIRLGVAAGGGMRIR